MQHTTLLSTSEQLQHSTVRIEAITPNGISTGTGFHFYLFPQGNISVPVIITNKHVVKDATQVTLYISTCDENKNPIFGKHEQITLTDFQNEVVPHPNNEVDLAAIRIAKVFNEMRSNGLRPFFIGIGKTDLPSDSDLSSLSALENIIMIGYPNGLWDTSNNLPILRRGITATPVYMDYNGRKEFIIDAACFPGSSGSPVFIYNEGPYTTRAGNMVMGERLLLVGILYAGPQYRANGEIIVEAIPTAFRPVPITNIPTNLGFCIKSSRILEFEMEFLRRGIVSVLPKGSYSFIR